MILVILNKQYGSHFVGNGHFDCWIKDDSWVFSVTMFQDLGFILHCFVIMYSCCEKKNNDAARSIKCYRRNIMKNYIKFIGIYVILWIPNMVSGIFDVIVDGDQLPFLVTVLELSFLLSTGIANGIIWHTNKGTYPNTTKLIINKKSPTVLNINEKRIGINNSRIITFTFKPFSDINKKSNINTETQTSSLPLDYDPASKIGPRSMYNGDDDTPSMMLIDNTVNQCNYDITSVIVTEDGDPNETRLF